MHSAKKIAAENKYAQSKQETLALLFEQNSILQDYNDKIAKVNGDKYHGECRPGRWYGRS